MSHESFLAQVHAFVAVVATAVGVAFAVRQGVTMVHFALGCVAGVNLALMMSLRSKANEHGGPGRPAP